MLGAGFKAGIIMGIVVAVVDVILNLVGLSTNPILGMVACLLSLLILVLWFVSGILAARFGVAALTTGAAAGAGAIAGAITQVIGGIVDVVMTVITQALGLATVQIPPDLMRQLGQAGATPQEIRSIVSMMQLLTGPVGSCICCVGIATAIAAGLGALGGIVGKAISRGKDS